MLGTIVSIIDHAVLHPTATEADLVACIAVCRQFGVASICVKPCYVAFTSEQLVNSSVLVSTVIGFPLGGAATEIKVAETHLACQQGAREVDMVANLGKVFDGDWRFVETDIINVVEAARSHGAITKVIFETGLLPNDETKIRLCQSSEVCGAAFVKTSTGFGFVKSDKGLMSATGATEHDVRLMRAACSPAVQIKASGGIRSYADALRFVELGATRLGTSSTQTIAAGELGGKNVSSATY